MTKLFGTDGVRGVANVAPMDSETMLKLGRAAAVVFRRSEGRHRIVIGKDTRLSGYLLETALSSGISSMGVDVLLVGPIPTPGIAFMTRSMRADAGVMISASHNSFEDNGVKFFGADGLKLPDEMEAEIEQLMNPGSVDSFRASPDSIGKAFRIDDAIGRYTVFLKSCFERTFSLEGKKIVLDCANGAAYRVAPLVFSELGAELILLGVSPNGRNINEGCGSLHPEKMAEVVKREKAHCGIAFDGDADRVVFCDELGNIVDGDTLLAICAIDFQETGRLRGNAVVGTVMSNMGLDVALKQKGITLYRSDVGDRYVVAEMLSKNLVLGGEQSGHILSLDHNTTGDGILSALLVLHAMSRKNQRLSDLGSVVKRYPQVLINIAVARRPPIEEVPVLSDAIKKAEKELSTRGRILFRYSGTERKARVMVECDDALLCNKVAESLAAIVRAELG